MNSKTFVRWNTRHRAMYNSFVMNLISALVAYCFFEKKPVLRFDMKRPRGNSPYFIDLLIFVLFSILTN